MRDRPGTQPRFPEKRPSFNNAERLMVDSTLRSSVIGGLTKIPLDTPEEVFGRLWKQAVEDFISRAQLSNDEKASICRHPSPEEAFNPTRREWNSLNEKQLSRHQKGQRAVDTVLGILALSTAHWAWLKW